jgi:N6-L-threonylcarbamoyladenine synthase
MIVAIDTSCYTTSLALIGADGQVLADRRIMLAVARGERGLRQSEAFFQHVQNLPRLLDEAWRREPVTAVAAATMPRPVPGAYLPVFQAGASFAELLAKTLDVPFYKTTHQEGHIRAGFAGETPPDRPFLVWHISGGTTELLWVRPRQAGYEIEKIGGTSDLPAGQFIDRVGVAMGTAFPAGPELEQLALKSSADEALPIAVQDYSISFSGPESAAQRLIKQGADPRLVSRQVLNCISRSLLPVTEHAMKEYKTKLLLLVGGVAANQLLREAFQANFKNCRVRFGSRELSGDNAVGVGLLGYDQESRGMK